MSAHQRELHLPPRPADEILKERAHLAALSLLAAERAGDIELVEAARKRFLDASALLAPQSTGRETP